MFVHQSAEYQNRRGEEKRREAARRAEMLDKQATDITPANKDSFIWSKEDGKIDKFEQAWSMKPVKVSGIFDHTRENRIEKMRNGEKGVDIVTPFYTHLDGKG